MERVAFLTPGNEPPLTCLLNPESLTQRRIAGVRQRRTASGPLTGAGLSDDPLLFTGGGRTELDLDLLFDVSLSESPVKGDDVRSLTRRLWNLAENTEGDGDRARPQVVRFMWGKSWNILGVVISVAERLESFDPEGVPQRSWLRLRMLRVSEDMASEETVRQATVADLPTVTQEGLEQGRVHQTTGGADAGAAEAGVAPELEGTLLPLAAEDLVAQALAETSVEAQLDSAWGDLDQAGRMLDELLALLARDAGEGEGGQEEPDAGSSGGQTSADETASADETTSPDAQAPAAAQELRAGMDEVQRVQAQVADAPKARLVEALTLAGATIAAGLDRLRAAGVELLEQAPKEPEESEQPKMTVRQRLAAVLQRVGAAARKVRDAASRAAAAIKAKAVVVIAAATLHMQGLAQHLDAIAAPVSAAVSTAAAQAWETIRGVTAEIDQAARSVFEAGKVFVVEKLGPALGRLAAAANRLWLEGQVAAARGVSRAVEGLSLSMQHVRAGAEAMASAARTHAAALVEGAAERIRATLQDLRAGHERQATLAVRQDLAALSAAAGTMAAATGTVAGEDALVEQLAAARALVSEPDALAQPGAPQHVLEAVAAIVETVQERVADETELDAHAIADAGAVAADATPAAAAPAETAALSIGDRLDQLAYRYYRDPALWRLLATVNDIDHPLRMGAGSLLRIPPASALRTSS